MQNPHLKRSTPYFVFALVLLFAAATGFFYHRNNFRGLSTEALDCAQLARNIFRGEGFATNLISGDAPTKLVSASNGRSFNPDLSHAPLFPLFLGGIFAFAGERDGVVSAFSLGLYLLSAALLWVLARRLTDNLILTAATVIAFALSLPVLGLADSGQPQALSGCFLLLALLALTPKIAIAPDEKPHVFFLEDEESAAPAAELIAKPEVIANSERFDDSEEDPTAGDSDADDEDLSVAPGLSPKNYFVAGLMAALCTLSDPLALIFLVPLCFLWGRADGGWNRSTVLAFLGGFVLFSLPWWIRNARLTGNPFYSQQWLASSGQGNGSLSVVGNFRRGIGSFFYGVAGIPHLYLMPFIVVAAWMSPRLASLARFKSATLMTVVITIFVSSLLGRGDTIQLLPLAPLLTLVGLMTFQQIVSDARAYRLQTGTNSGSFGNTLLIGSLSVLKLHVMKANLIARQSYEAQIESSTFKDKRWTLKLKQQLQSLTLLLLVLALPLLLQQSQPKRADARALLQPLSRLVPKGRAIMTDVPQLVAWYNDRKVISLPEQVISLSGIEKNQRIGAIYLSGQGNGQLMPNQWLQAVERGLDLPGYQKITNSDARNIVYLKQVSLDEARQAVKSKPQNAEAMVTLGASLLEKGQFREALKTFTAGQRLQPKASAAFLGAGKAQLSLRNEAAALVQFNRALQIEPRSIPALLGAAQISQTSGKTAQATAFYERVLADNPDNPIALNNLAQLYADQGNNLYRALEMVRRAAARNPNNGSILDTLGWVCYRIGYRREALTYLKRAAELSPKNETIASHLQTVQDSKAVN